VNEGFDISTSTGRSADTSRWLVSGLIVILGVLSGGLYLMIFRPMAVEVAHLETGLERTHQKITETGFGYSGDAGAYLENAQLKLERMRNLADELSERTSFSSSIEELLSSSFRVLEFEQRRFDIQQSLTQLAEEQGSSLPADLFAGLPSYYTTTDQQQQLWLHLEFFNHVMVALLSSGGGLQIEQIESMPLRTPEATTAMEVSLLELQIRLKVRGALSSLAPFLNASGPGGGASASGIGAKAYSIAQLDLQGVAADGQLVMDSLLSGFILSDQIF
jgi:hypothetical protein